jgi:predicted phosphoribosyltransferase
MGAIGEYYENFMQVSDERVIQVLAEAKRASERNSLD